ncbi:Redox-sensitive transcriptional regulator (AT-rich DNA-binding protein) [Lachnospiraceae bacterium TWA4]|nr:Redox-sensitive transcriptional regulator (AT-rich DNA-binding protein) [Lachnospiraceae bacterium TWA4]
MEKKEISSAVIKRLPRYYRYLDELQSEGIERISSGDLSRKMNVTASQIRQDLNNFGGFGQQGYGYNVKNLFVEIGKILGLDEVHPMIVIGGGNMGRALSNYRNFRKRGFDIIGIFDVDPMIVGTMVNDTKIYHLSELENFVRIHKVEIAALAVPKNVAADVAERLVKLGIRAFWNFAHIDLELGEGVVVENVHLSESLMQLSYRMTEVEQK